MFKGKILLNAKKINFLNIVILSLRRFKSSTVKHYCKTNYCNIDCIAAHVFTNIRRRVALLFERSRLLV